MFRSILLLSLFVSVFTQASIFEHHVEVRMNNGSIRLLPIYEAVLRQGVSKEAVDQAFGYFEQNQNKIVNRNYITIIDYSLHSKSERLYLINVNTGKVDKLHVAHGRGSDEDHNGMADSFSNSPNSKKTSLGFFLTAETYIGQHGYSLRLDGLSSTNSNARARAIVIHGADYVKKGLDKMGRSYGCPAVDKQLSKNFIDKIKGGSLLFSYYKSAQYN